MTTHCLNNIRLSFVESFLKDTHLKYATSIDVHIKAVPSVTLLIWYLANRDPFHWILHP